MNGSMNYWMVKHTAFTFLLHLSSTFFQKEVANDTRDLDAEKKIERVKETRELLNETHNQIQKKNNKRSALDIRTAIRFFR